VNSKSSARDRANRRLVDALLKAHLSDSTPSHRFGRLWVESMDLVCFSHLRWDFVFQRPQHLMTRFAKGRRVFFFEEPLFEPGVAPRLDARTVGGRLCVVTPRLSPDLQVAQQHAILQHLLDAYFIDQGIRDYVAWYYTPMALGFTRHLHPRATVYDCMDELSAFKGAPPSLLDHESELLHRAEVVFTGGQSLYEAKRNQHPNIHAFPSSIERAHFAQARRKTEEPADQRGLAHPRLGFAGVIDERLDIPLLKALADARPNWQFVMVGPVVKIDPADLPKNPNIHYLGQKSYTDLPKYMAGWDVAMLPFARNESTRFISPTKTPEYLAAGCPVVSTPIQDVVRPYGEQELVWIADASADFIRCAEAAMHDAQADARWKKIDAFLSRLSWDATWEAMNTLIAQATIQHMNRRRSTAVRPPATERRRVLPVKVGRGARFFERRQVRAVS
jgi:UDP-galactopyranose mutase